jgi:peroxiredoxin
LGIIIAGLFQTKSSIGPLQSQNTTPGSVGLNVGQIAPNFTLSTLNGQKVSLSDYRGKAIMLNFWEVNCEGCRAELPGMIKTYQAQEKNNFVILGVNPTDEAGTAAGFARETGIHYPVLLDRNLQVDDLYNISGTPTSFFIDRQGIIRSETPGPLDEQELQQRINQIEQ